MLVHGCLEKEPRARVADIGVASFLLDHAAERVERVVAPLQASASAAAAMTRRRRRRWRLAAWMIAAGGVGALAAGAGMSVLTSGSPPAVVRLTGTTLESTAPTPSSADRALGNTPHGSLAV